MIEKENKKRYVYLDKYLDYQMFVNKTLKTYNFKINMLALLVMGSICAITAILYKIFG